MTPEAQRIAIAEACGWKPDYYDEDSGNRTDVWKNPRGFIQCLPDYLNDLNAMHEAEKTLKAIQWDAYCDWLGGSLYDCAHASAASRADALLRTIGKWEGDK